MTYSSGNTVLAADYNGFVGTVNTVIGNSASYQSTTGYGQSTLATVSAGATVSASSWASLITAVRTAATHQGTTVSLPGSGPASADTIEALDGTTSGGGTFNLSTAVTAINTNKNNVDTGEQTTIAPTTRATRGSTWSSSVDAEWYVQFASQAATDAFFNTGGEIHLAFTHPTGSSDQDNNWRDVLQNLTGTIKLGLSTLTRTGSAGTISTRSYTNMNGSYAAVFTGTNIGTGQYGSNDMIINSKLDTTNHRVYFNMTLTDSHTPVAPSTVDSVSAGTTIQVGFRKSSTYTIATPSVTISEAF